MESRIQDRRGLRQNGAICLSIHTGAMQTSKLLSLDVCLKALATTTALVTKTFSSFHRPAIA